MDPRRIFRKENEGTGKEGHKQELICWGIHVEPRLKEHFKALAAALGVPLQDLITAILEDWLAKYDEALQNDAVRHRFADRLRRRKLDGH